MNTLPLSHPPLDSFIGRQREIVELTAALEHSNLVTVVGPPGVGKTRLALEVAANSNSEVVVVELALVSEAEGVLSALASALGVVDSPGVAVAESVLAAISGRELLVVIDNCEHLVSASAEVATLLTGARALGVAVLATSREPLGISRELTYRLAPLATPGAEVIDLEAISSSAAVVLFVERATVASRNFVIDEANARSVAAICRHLDGIPLAIELAASRAHLLTPEQMAPMLERHFHILDTTSASAVSSHQTIDAAVAWSYELLSEPEQLLLRRLSVFSGATAQAAEEVCAGSGLAPDEVAGLLVQLSARSLLLADRRDSEPRYRQLQTVRHFAAERLLSAGESEEARNRHARWALGLAERAEPEITGPDQQAWLRRLDVEGDNLRAAMAWLIADEQATLALRLGGALTLWWRARGRLDEGRDLLIQALTLGQTVDSDAGLSRALWGAGYLDYAFGSQLAHWQFLERGLACARLAEDSSTTARILLTMAGRVSPADNLDLLDESCQLARDAADMWCLAHGLALRGTLTAQNPGQELEGRRLVDEAIHVARAAGDSQSLTYALNALSLVSSVDDETTSVAAATEMRDAAVERPLDRACALLRLGSLALARGQLSDAGAYLTDSGALFQRLGNPDPAYEVWLAQSRLATAGGDPNEARRLLETAAAHLDRQGLAATDIEIDLAYLALSQGHIRSAQELADHALTLAWPAAMPHNLVLTSLCSSTVERGGAQIDVAVAAATGALEHLRNLPGDSLVPDCLEVVAGLGVTRGDDLRSAAVFAAAAALRESSGRPRFTLHVPYYDDDMTTLRRRLDPIEYERAWSEGAALSPAEALELAAAAMESTAAHPEPWPDLTRTEASVADLVAEGLTNRQISERLGNSPTTVRAHMSSIFEKLALSSRAELGREVAGPVVGGQTGEGQDEITTSDATQNLSFAEFLESFPDDDSCLEYLWRWRHSPDGEHALCPTCAEERVFNRSQSGSRRWWTCSQCNRHIHPTATTILVGSKGSLRDWFVATYLSVSTGCTMSAKQLQRELGVSYKTAWRMVAVIRRQLLQSDTGQPSNAQPG